MTGQDLLQHTFVSRRPRVTNFVDIIKIAIMLIKRTCRHSKKENRSRESVIKYNFCLYFSI